MDVWRRSSTGSKLGHDVQSVSEPSRSLVQSRAKKCGRDTERRELRSRRTTAVGRPPSRPVIGYWLFGNCYQDSLVTRRGCPAAAWHRLPADDLTKLMGWDARMPHSHVEFRFPAAPQQ